MATVWCSLYISDKLVKELKFKRAFEDFADLQDAVWESRKANLHYCGSGDIDVYPPGTTLPLPPDSQCYPSSSALPDGMTNFVVIAPEEEPDRKTKSHVLQLLKTAQEAFSESGTRKSDKLLRVKGSKACFLCTTKKNVEASHVFQKSDVSFRKGGEDLAYNTLEILKDWRDGYKWKRPFEIHGAMNLIWLCHTHNLQFDAHKFCLKVDMSNRVLFHAFDLSFGDLVDQANTRLLDPAQDSYDMSYVSRRAIGMRILQSQERSGRYLNHDNVDSWKAVVALSSAASLSGRSEGEEAESGDSTERSSQDLHGFNGEEGSTAISAS